MRPLMTDATIRRLVGFGAALAKMTRATAELGSSACADDTQTISETNTNKVRMDITPCVPWWLSAFTGTGLDFCQFPLA
jgi:hypothetical protein